MGQWWSNLASFIAFVTKIKSFCSPTSVILSKILDINIIHASSQRHKGSVWIILTWKLTCEWHHILQDNSNLCLLVEVACLNTYRERKINKGAEQSLNLVFVPVFVPLLHMCVCHAIPNSDDSRQCCQPAVPFHLKWRHSTQCSDPLQVLLSPQPWCTALHYGHSHYWQVL